MANFVPLPNYTPSVIYGNVPRKRDYLQEAAIDTASKIASQFLGEYVDDLYLTKEEENEAARQAIMDKYYGSMGEEASARAALSLYELEQLKKAGAEEEFVPPPSPDAEAKPPPGPSYTEFDPRGNAILESQEKRDQKLPGSYDITPKDLGIEGPPEDVAFDTEQDRAMQNWLRQRAGLPPIEDDTRKLLIPGVDY